MNFPVDAQGYLDRRARHAQAYHRLALKGADALSKNRPRFVARSEAPTVHDAAAHFGCTFGDQRLQPAEGGWTFTPGAARRRPR